jgi:Na+/H+-dicarboxylate symporter
MKFKSTFLKSYSFSLILIASIVAGSVLGFLLGDRASYLKPLGEVFLNLLFTLVVPIVFFSLSSAVAVMADTRRLGKIMAWMILIFALTGLFASIIMVIGVRMVPPGVGIRLPVATQPAVAQQNLSDQIVRTFTVSDFSELLSKKNMLALIVFSILVGLAASAVGEKGRPFTQFLLSGNDVAAKVLSYVMLYAPVGLGAYFAAIVGKYGPEILGSYGRAMALYYPVTLLYFFLGFSFYAWLAAGGRGVRAFWANIIPASLTAWATGSSVATIPSNLEAADRVGVPQDIREVVIPIGATIHMDGSCLGAVLKIALLFGLYGRPLGIPEAIGVVGVALLCGIVVSGIPGGGVMGELLIVGLYGFPPEALPLINMIGQLIDPPATMVNAIGDNVAGMMVARVLEGRNWMAKSGAADRVTAA